MSSGFGEDSNHSEFLQLVESHDVAWQAVLKTWLDGMPTPVSLQEALEPMLLPLSAAPEGQGFTVEVLKQIIVGTLSKMEAKLMVLNLDGKYSVHHAGCLNTYTQDTPNPRWFRFVSRVLNDTEKRMKDNQMSEEAISCGKFLKLFQAACEALPAEYIHKDTCWRGVNWVFPNPRFPARDRYLYPGRRAFFFTIRSFSTSLEVAQRFAGQGLRTIFQTEPECLAYKISSFSDFPQEQEVVFPILHEFECRATEAHIAVSLEHADDTKSNFHSGDPDIVHIKHIIPLQKYPAKAAEVEALQVRLGKDFSALDYFFKNGSLIPRPCRGRAVASAEVTVQVRDAIVGAVQEMVEGKRAIFLVGATGSGKSTLANWLVGNPVEIGYAQEGHAGSETKRKLRFLKALPKTPQIRIATEGISFPVGMDNTASMTFLPTAVQIDKFEDAVLVDFPGFFDSTSMECRIGIDLALRDLVNLAKEAHVLALAEIASVVGAKGDGFKMQLAKVKRHLPPLAKWRLGITKCDEAFAPGNKEKWMHDAVQHLEQLCPELLENEDESIGNSQVLDINSELIFNDEGLVPHEFIKMLLESDKVPPLRTPLNSDCLDRDIEDFTRRFQERGFMELFDGHFKAADTPSMEMIVPDPDDWQSLVRQTKTQAETVRKYAHRMRNASEEMRLSSRLSIQAIVKPIDVLCSTKQTRLIGGFLAAEEKAVEVQQRVGISEFKTLQESARKMGEGCWLRSTDAKRLAVKLDEVQVALDSIAKTQGYTDAGDQINLGRPDPTAHAVVLFAEIGCIAGCGMSGVFFESNAAGFAMAGAGFGPLGMCIAGGCVVGFGLFGIFLAMRKPGNQYSSEIADNVCEALGAITEANRASQEHLAALSKLRSRVEAAKQ